MKLPINLILGGISSLSKLKGLVFADGKFAPKRALTLLVFLIILLLSNHYLGEETTANAIDQLDEVSDQIGYEGEI